MSTRYARHLLILLPAALALPACAQSPGSTTAGAASGATAEARADATPATQADATAGDPADAVDAAAALPLVVVNKSPTCGCCVKWVDHLRAAGFPVEVRNTHALHAVKEQLGIPTGKGSCHTAVVDGYVVEGHVPAGDIKRLLAERPDARGLVLPGMPLGSPGMEVPDGRTQPYTVELLEEDGSTSAFATH